MAAKNSSVRDDLVECLTQQLSEIDLLQSMYPNRGDIVLTDKNITEIRNFINLKSEYVSQNLDFVMNLFINDLKIEVFIDLPLCYPIETPDVYIRCNQMNRHQETSVNIGLSEFLKINHVGEVCIYTAIIWLQDNIATFIAKDAEILKSPSDNEPRTEDKFSRLWIYAHHIYNKKKREVMLKLAKEFKLTGFCLPGKPGIICIEGDSQACNEWWKIVKNMCWQKISIKKTEIFELSDEPQQRKFHSFEELHFKNPVNNKHSNMSEFSKYMSNHGFNQVFCDLFGLFNE